MENSINIKFKKIWCEVVEKWPEFIWVKMGGPLAGCCVQTRAFSSSV